MCDCSMILLSWLINMCNTLTGCSVNRQSLQYLLDKCHMKVFVQIHLLNAGTYIIVVKRRNYLHSLCVCYAACPQPCQWWYHGQRRCVSDRRHMGDGNHVESNGPSYVLQVIVWFSEFIYYRISYPAVTLLACDAFITISENWSLTLTLWHPCYNHNCSKY